MNFNVKCDNCKNTFNVKLNKERLQELFSADNFYFHCSKCTKEVVTDLDLPEKAYSVHLCFNKKKGVE